MDATYKAFVTGTVTAVECIKQRQKQDKDSDKQLPLLPHPYQTLLNTVLRQVATALT